jgi:hypothetical protein
MPTGRQEVISLDGVSLNASPVGRPVYWLYGDCYGDHLVTSVFAIELPIGRTCEQDYVHGALA